MARYKHYDYRQTKMLPVSFDRQILPGTFEYTLSELIDHQIDLSVFEERYKNDASGAPAYDPAILLKIILFAYSRGITHSRQIEALCRENVVCMALSADTVPHFTTIAGFVSSLSDEITTIFRNVLLVYDEAGLIGKEMFAVDGVKLPSNASREWSGTQAEYSKKIQKMQRAVEHLVSQHRYSDQRHEPAQWQARERQIQTLNKAIDKVRGFLQGHEDKVGPSGRVKKSNITDNDSAKMPSSKGVIQGYDGLAMVDGKHQIIVHAQAYGEGQEHSLLIPMIEGTQANFVELNDQDVSKMPRCWRMQASAVRRTRSISTRSRSTATLPIRCSASAILVSRMRSITSRLASTSRTLSRRRTCYFSRSTFRSQRMALTAYVLPGSGYTRAGAP